MFLGVLIQERIILFTVDRSGGKPYEKNEPFIFAIYAASCDPAGAPIPPKISRGTLDCGDAYYDGRPAVYQPACHGGGG